MKNILSWPKNFVIIGILIALSTSCQRQNLFNTEIMVVINGEPAISVTEFYGTLERAKLQVLDDSVAIDKERYAQFKKRVLRAMIREYILINEANRANIVVSDEELHEQVGQIKDLYGNQINRALLYNYLEFDEFVQDQHRRLLIAKLIDQVVAPKVTVSEDEILEVYNHNYQKGKIPSRVKVLQIVVSRYSEAVKIKKRLRRGEDFASIAKQESISPEGKTSGGDLGYISKGDYPEEFDIVFSLPVGQVSEIVVGDYGFHIFKVVNRKPERKVKLSDVRAEIEQDLVKQKSEEAFSQWIREVASRYTVEQNLEILNKLQ